jgi:ribosomal protein RSM22 (predicted rRNA methylase)
MESVSYRGQVAASGPGLPAASSLTAAVQAALTGAGTGNLGTSVQRLIAAYRAGEVPPAPVITSRIDAAAYAAYRMPATAAATAAALRETRLSLPGWAPSSLIDFGAGTGGSAWAVASDLPGIETITLLEQSPDAIRLGKAIFAQAQSAVLRSAAWRQWQLGDSDEGPARPAAAGLPAADLATACYVLGELSPPQQAALTMLAAGAAPAVLFVEPGTPAGHRRILAARARLLSSGYRVAAPCPHERDCPLDVDGDWCHFGARLQRSAMHRQAKGAELAYEDEKFSYVAAIRRQVSRPDAGAPDLPAGRVVRRPQQRKGLVLLDLCRADGTSSRELVSKSKGESYRRARKTAWGDRWQR